MVLFDFITSVFELNEWLFAQDDYIVDKYITVHASKIIPENCSFICCNYPLGEMLVLQIEPCLDDMRELEDHEQQQ